jgi:hypothetical protein
MIPSFFVVLLPLSLMIVSKRRFCEERHWTARAGASMIIVVWRKEVRYAHER